MQQRPTDGRPEGWSASLHKNDVCFLVLCHPCVRFENNTHRAAIGMELEYNENAFMIRVNCKQLRYTVSVLRNTEVCNELTLDISEPDRNQQVEENAAHESSEQFHSQCIGSTYPKSREIVSAK
jgi:hypothetical protein